MPLTLNQVIIPNEGMPKSHPNILHHLYLEYDADEAASWIPHRYQSLHLHQHTSIENHIAAMPERPIVIQALLPHLYCVHSSIQTAFSTFPNFSLLLPL